MHCRVLVLFLAVVPLAAATPVDFGKAELQRALAERRLKLAVTTEVVDAPPETYRIVGTRISGGDLRGVMYGLLDAAEQVRTTGRIAPSEGKPATAIRGIRRFLHNAEMERTWYHSREYWTEFFRMLARNRFNRFNLVFAHQTNYMAPPYPYWLSLPDFPEVQVPGLTKEQQARNLETLKFISQTAADCGIDFTLGIWQHDIQPGQTATVAGLSPLNIELYSYTALKAVLAACPAIRSVQVRTNAESGIPREQQVQFYRDFIFPAIAKAGRRVTLDLRGWMMHPDMLDGAVKSGLPVRLSTKYWAEMLGRPYQPAETWPSYSYFDFLRKPRQWNFYWELWGLGSNRLLLWGDPEYVRRAVPTFTLSGSSGFEIDPPLAQKGYGNAPEDWAIFTDTQGGRVFWKYDFERYWMFYLPWGRLSYDPKTPDRVWLSEMERRFGKAAAPLVLSAYENASRMLPEVVAAHLADPNMYIWPEINPGGLIDAYRQVLPSDGRFIAGPVESVHNRMTGAGSAKQDPLHTATLLLQLADSLDDAMIRANKSLGTESREWSGTAPDFQVLSSLARYHARKQLAAEHLETFYQTGDEASLFAARREASACLRIWRDLVQITDGLYPPNMSYGPDDKGHWKDKLPYVEQDVATIDARIRIWRQFGRFEYGFDFGAAVETPDPTSYRRQPYVLQNTVEPRFTLVTPETAADAYGWETPGDREAVPLTLTPYPEVRATVPNPSHLPHNTLYGDAIRGHSTQVFRVRAPDGDYIVHVLKPDGKSAKQSLKAEGGTLKVTFEGPEWTVSGLVIQAVKPGPPVPAPQWPRTLPRPQFQHTPAEKTAPGQPLTVTLHITPPQNVRVVRLHYRPVNQLAAFKTLEAPASKTAFTIPGADIDGAHDLMYYFEVINTENAGWFYPDPHVTTPYYVVKVER